MYIDSIGKMTQEYLVNWDYVSKKVGEYGLKVSNLKRFSEYYKKQKVKFPEELQQFSFYNLSFEIEKDIKG